MSKTTTKMDLLTSMSTCLPFLGTDILDIIFNWLKKFSKNLPTTKEKSILKLGASLSVNLTKNGKNLRKITKKNRMEIHMEEDADGNSRLTIVMEGAQKLAVSAASVA